VRNEVIVSMAEEKPQVKTPKAKKQEKKENVVGTRGRTFTGAVTKKFPTRAVIEFEKTIYIPKFERYAKRKTKLHAKIPENLDVNLNDLVQIQETRPLSKIIHFQITKIITKSEDEKK
jgi:small subunit ribosomal protein S17